MKDKFKEIIESWPKKWRSRKIVNYPEIQQFLNNLYPNVSVILQIHCFLEEVSPYCCVCNNPIKFVGKKTCSIACREVVAKSNIEEKIKKQKITLLEKYGVDNIRNIPGVKEKTKKTMLEKYGGFTSPKTIEKAKERIENLNRKGRKTLNEKWGVTNPGQIESHTDKCKQTLLKNYGVDNYFKSDEFKNISNRRRLEKLYNFCPSSIEILNISESEEKNKLFENPNKIIEFKCLTCLTNGHTPSETFKWRIKTTGTSCFKCGGLSSNSSLKEKEVGDFIENDLSLVIQRNKKIIEGGLEIDIYIPSLQIGIEFDGLFWHNDLRLDKKYHHNKTILAKNKGIKLIHIFEDEWEHKKDIVKSRLRAITNKIETKIGARKCLIKEICFTEEKRFLQENHIQGWARSSVKLGLFYDDKLISVMTFSKPNIAKGQKQENNTWELLRYCSSKNLIVTGGAKKLFDYFVTHWNPDKILSFADSRWSTGDLYNHLNFQKEKDTNLNYWYIDLKQTKRIHRFGLRKTKQDDQTLSEYKNRLNQGYLRIWDCGNSKWIWKKGSQ